MAQLSSLRLLLTSGGLYTQEIIMTAENLAEKKRAEISVAIINEAYAVEKGDKRWNIDEVKKVSEVFGGNIDLVNILALPKQEVITRVKSSDVIYVVGGHTDYLMHVFNTSGFSEILTEFLNEKVYIGSSAGSMILGRRISSEAYEKVYGEQGDYGVKKYLEVVNFAIKPHLDSELFKQNRKEVLQEISNTYAETIYGLKDDQAIVVKNQDIQYLGGSPLQMCAGQVLT